MVEEDPDTESSELLTTLFFSMLEELKLEVGEDIEVVCDADDIFHHEDLQNESRDTYPSWEPDDLPQCSYNIGDVPA